MVECWLYAYFVLYVLIVLFYEFQYLAQVGIHSGMHQHLYFHQTSVSE
jgi:hypothetical protein